MPQKVIELNIELGRPTVDMAIQKLKNSLTTYKMQGFKAVIIIHGYGSSGEGGSIKPAVRSCLSEGNMRGIVRAFAGGEQWYSAKRNILGMCKALENYDAKIANNEGITVVVLR